MTTTGTPAKFLDRERSAVDLPVAGLAALAVAFAAFAVPDALLGRAVEATGLPELLAAAQPPLGNTARLSIAVAGAVVAFFAAFTLLGWLDRFASRGPAMVRVEPISGSDAPRINKADAHPDAPPRRPISATRDLGEPAPPSNPRAAASSEPAITAEPPAVAVATQTVSPEPKTVLAREAPSAQVSPRAVPPVLPVARTAAPPPHAAEQPRPSASATLCDLMARLEQGLARRQQEAPAPAARSVRTPTASAPTAAAAASASAQPASPSKEAPSPRTPSNDRLQSALEGLRALSV